MKRPILVRFRLAAMMLPFAVIAGTQRASAAEKLAPKYSVGDRVVQRNPAFKLRTGPEETVRQVSLDIWRVEKVEGPKLWISAEYLGIVGCTRAEQVIRVDRAITYFRGQAWFAKQEYDKAIADYSEVIRLKPDNAGAYFNRSAAWREKGDNARATADYTTCIGLDPAFGLPRSDQGSVPPKVRDQRNDIDEFVRTWPLEHANAVVSEKHFVSAVTEIRTPSGPIDLAPAPMGQDGKPAAVTANSTANHDPETVEKTTYLSPTAEVTGTRELIKGTVCSQEPGAAELLKRHYDSAIRECDSWLAVHPDSATNHGSSCTRKGSAAAKQCHDVIPAMPGMSRHENRLVRSHIGPFT